MRTSLKATSILLSTPVFLFLIATTTFAGWRCCRAQDNACGAATTECDGGCSSTELKKSLQCGSDNACPAGSSCGNCSYGMVPVSCSTGGGDTGTAACTQSIYALSNPTYMSIGEVKNFYADANVTSGNFAKMTAIVSNVPASTPLVATVLGTSGVTCYAGGNCRQSFSLTGKTAGSGFLRVTSQVKPCPACAVTSSCTNAVSVHIGVPPLQCKLGTTCTSDTGKYAVGSNVTCKMPLLTKEESLGGVVNYQQQCTPYKGSVAQAVISKNSTTGSFLPFKIALGVTNVKCSFRHCVTASTGVVSCSAWGTAKTI